MFEEDPGVFFVDTYRVLDGLARSCSIDEIRIHVVDRAFAITSKRKAVRHVTASVFSKVECVFPLMWMFGIAVWDYHFRQR